MRLQARRVARELATMREEMHRALKLGPFASNANSWQVWCADWLSVLDKSLLMLALPKRKVRVKDVSVRAATVKELDALCRDVVFARDKTCRWAVGCAGLASLQWCHCYSRRYKWLRWDLDNSFVLCAGHHLQWHHRPLEAAAWWEKELGPVAYKSLVQRAGRPSKVNLVAVQAYLEKARLEYVSA